MASLRKSIDLIRLPEVSSQTRWVKEVPIKINVLAWKVKLDALPSRFNISRRGMDIASLSCPMCDCGVESTHHIFFVCQVARDILNKICRWWNVDYMEVSSSEEWLCWLINIRVSAKLKKVLEGVCYGAWCIFGLSGIDVFLARRLALKRRFSMM